MAIISLLKDYGFDTDVNYGGKYAGQLFELSQRYELSAYDATYLELAIRKNAKLATLDEKLGKACKKAGIGSAVEWGKAGP